MSAVNKQTGKSIPNSLNVSAYQDDELDYTFLIFVILGSL
jgi:hypothetical protein